MKSKIYATVCAGIRVNLELMIAGLGSSSSRVAHKIAVILTECADNLEVLEKTL